MGHEFFLSVFRLFSDWYSLGNDNSLNNGAIFLIKQWRLTSYYFSRTRGQNPRMQKKKDFKLTKVAIKWKYAPLTLSCVLVTLHGLSICLFSCLNSFLPLDRKASLGRRENTLPVELGRLKSWFISYVLKATLAICLCGLKQISYLLRASVSPSLKWGNLLPSPQSGFGN